MGQGKLKAVAPRLFRAATSFLHHSGRVKCVNTRQLSATNIAVIFSSCCMLAFAVPLGQGVLHRAAPVRHRTEAYSPKRSGRAIIYRYRTASTICSDCPRGRPWRSIPPRTVPATSSRPGRHPHLVLSAACFAELPRRQQRTARCARRAAPCCWVERPRNLGSCLYERPACRRSSSAGSC